MSEDVERIRELEKALADALSAMGSVERKAALSPEEYRRVREVREQGYHVLRKVY